MVFAILTGTFDPVADDGMAPGDVQRIWWHTAAQFVIALVTTGLLAARTRLAAYRKVPPEAVAGLLGELVAGAVFNYYG